MSVRMKITHSKTRGRRSHHALAAPTTTPTEGGGVRRRHFADPATGVYRGRAVGKKHTTRAATPSTSSKTRAKAPARKVKGGK